MWCYSNDGDGDNDGDVIGNDGDDDSDNNIFSRMMDKDRDKKISFGDYRQSVWEMLTLNICFLISDSNSFFYKKHTSVLVFLCQNGRHLATFWL